MTKGKKQQSTGADCDISLRSSTFMSDDEYAQVGSLLRQAGAAREGVVVDPCDHPRGRLGISQTPLGRMPRSLMTAFGLEDALIDTFVRDARPRCSRCGMATQRSEALNHDRWPDSGYVAIVVDGVEESVSLEQQCELLDVERAVIEEMLVRKDDIEGREGEPVLSVASASDLTHISREVERWFSRGGAPLRLVHFPSRSDRGVEIQKLFKEWRCPSCGDAYPAATRQRIEDAPPCQRCRGEGWLLVEDDRFVACEDCDAFGRTSSFAHYEVAGSSLKDLPRVTFGEVRDYLKGSTNSERDEVAHRIDALCEEGLSGYPIGTPVALLSKGEKVLATIASARVSELHDVELMVDAGALGVSNSWIDAIVQRNQPPCVRVVSPHVTGVEPFERRPEEDRVCTLRDVVLGPLAISSFSFDVGGLTVVQGEPGVGKSLLLWEVSRRFSKRKKLAHLASFGDLKRCHLIKSDAIEGDAVMELLGIAPHIAEQAARTRHARERGFLKEDFLLSRSRHRCDFCKGTPSVESARCSLCDGSLFDHVVGGVVVNNVPFAELMRSSLARVGEVLWADDELIAIVERVPLELRTSLELMGAARGLSPAAQRFLHTLGALASVLARKGSLDGDLVLVDVPFGTTSAYQGVLLQCINELRSRGATIVCAGMPETLESYFSSVVRLRFVAEPRRGEDARRFLDVRMTRKSEVVVER